MSAARPAFSRRAGVSAAAAALLVGAAPVAATAADGQRRRGGRGRAERARHDAALQRDVAAVRATGATGVLAEVQTAGGRAAARAGTADLATGRPVPWDAYYRIGSDTKPFTATVALQLVGEGALALTDPVERWLPGLVRGNGNDGRRITLANLLRHTSGLADYLAASGEGEPPTPAGYRAGRFSHQTPRQQVAAALSQPPGWLPDADAPARERRWSYSNTNYVLAGLIIERVTGHSWAQEVHERVIEPLGLRHTLAPGTSPYVPQPTATAYTAFPGERGLTDTTLAFGGYADGSLISTPRELATFWRALFGGRLLRPAQLAAMRQTVPAPDWIAARGVRYGLGVAWRPVRGSSDGIWFHGGTHLGTVSESGVRPDGSRAATAAVFTLRMACDAADAQARAALRLVDNALGGTGGAD
ncbi:serine hydrolase domain-containing protein [Streptomyces buecherae]|uniref:serine hydrolase domain-containing protein n=1 Tax=Streptomyces buecherae TaxID=2763006 RepID=UPI0027DED8B8|nr:serine hydrolase domain-containing protein [Streptomyces buecherae]